MNTHRRRALAALAITAVALGATQPPAPAHTKSIKSRVTLQAGYGYFHGKVKSPMTACRANRKIKLFKFVDGSDPLLGSTTSNAQGEWAIFRNYEEATFYLKVPARTIRRKGHKHTCKATTSLPATAPNRVTPNEHPGWTVKYFDCLEYEQNPDGAAPTTQGPIMSHGPGTPPLGFGSLQLIDPEVTLGFSFSDIRWDGLDGRSLSSLKTISFSSYVTDTAPPPTVHLFVDANGDGSVTEEITFTPSSSAVITDQWQKWTAGLSSTWDTPDGDMTLSEYQTANPSAEFDDSPEHGLQFLSDCPQGGNKLHYMDAVIVRLADETLTFDFEP